MNTLVVFDSQYGNTEKIAREIGKTMGEYGNARALRVNEVTLTALDGIELLIVGSPTQAWNSTFAMKNFFTQFEPAHKNLAFAATFDTRVDKPRLITGSAAYAMAKELRRCGITMLLKPKSFLVTGMEGPLAEGELEHATEWARELHAEFQRQMQRFAVPT